MLCRLNMAPSVIMFLVDVPKIPKWVNNCNDLKLVFSYADVSMLFFHFHPNLFFLVKQQNNSKTVQCNNKTGNRKSFQIRL